MEQIIEEVRVTGIVSRHPKMAKALKLLRGDPEKVSPVGRFAQAVRRDELDKRERLLAQSRTADDKDTAYSLASQAWQASAYSHVADAVIELAEAAKWANRPAAAYHREKAAKLCQRANRQMEISHAIARQEYPLNSAVSLGKSNEPNDWEREQRAQKWGD